MYARVLARLFLLTVFSFGLPIQSKAAPVTYEIGGTFNAVNGSSIVVPFEGEAFTFQFTFDADNVQPLLYAPGLVGWYTHAYTNFKFTTIMNGQPYIFATPNLDSGYDFYPGNRSFFTNNVPYFPRPAELDAAEWFSYAEIDAQNLPMVDPSLEVNGYLPSAMGLGFLSLLDSNGQNGLDFLDNVEPNIDPIYLNNSFNFGSYGNYTDSVGDNFKTFTLSFVSLESGLQYDENGIPMTSNVFTDFSYIRIIDNPTTAVDEPASLMISVLGIFMFALYRRRKKLDA